MSYFAAVFARTPHGWTGKEADLDEVESLDDIADLMSDAADEGDPVLLLVEENDEWFAVARMDRDSDLRVFISDVRAPLTSELAAIFAEYSADEDDRDRAQVGGDLDLLDDLGTNATDLVALATEKGLLPADALLALAERAGFGDEYDQLR